MGQRRFLNVHFFKILGAFAVLFCVGLGVLQAQFFNLENEDDVKVNPSQNAGAGQSKTPIKISVTELPETPEESAELEKNYQSILTTLKDNKVKEGMAMLSQYDVLTKQKLLNRLRKEDFGDRSPNATNEAVDNNVENTAETTMREEMPKAEEAVAPSASEYPEN